MYKLKDKYKIKEFNNNGGRRCHDDRYFNNFNGIQSEDFKHEYLMQLRLSYQQYIVDPDHLDTTKKFLCAYHPNDGASQNEQHAMRLEIIELNPAMKAEYERQLAAFIKQCDNDVYVGTV
jgi:hypothetical protein